MGIQSIGDRIIVSDVQESIHFVKYRRGENQLVVFADDTSPRLEFKFILTVYTVYLKVSRIKKL